MNLASPYDPALAGSPLRERTRRGTWSEADRWGWWCAAISLAIWGVGYVTGFTNAMMLFALAGFGGGLLGFRWPIVGLYSIGVLCVLDTPMRSCLLGWAFFRDNSLNYLLIMYSLVYLPLLLKRPDIHTWLLAGLVGLLALELLLSPGFERGLLHVINATAPFGLLVVAARGTKDTRVWFWMALLNGLTAAIGGAIYYLQKDSLPYVDRNGLAYFPLSGMFAICVGFRYAEGYRYGTVLLGILAALCGCWVLLTTSRGGMVVGLFATACLLVNLKGHGNRLMLIALSALIGFGVLTRYAETLEKSLGRFEKFTDENRSLASRTSGRSDLMKGAWDMFVDSPLGVGTGAFSNEYAERSQNIGDYSFGVGKMASAHSAWMKTLAENGLPGFLLLAAYVFSFAWVGWRRRREGLLAIGVLPTAAFSIAYLTTEFQGKGLWFLAACVTLLLHRPSALPAPLQNHSRTGN